MTGCQMKSKERQSSVHNMYFQYVIISNCSIHYYRNTTKLLVYMARLISASSEEPDLDPSQHSSGFGYGSESASSLGTGSGFILLKLWIGFGSESASRLWIQLNFKPDINPQSWCRFENISRSRWKYYKTGKYNN